MTCRRTPSERTTVRRSSRPGRQSVGSHAGKLMSGNPTHDLRAIRCARQRMRPHHAVRPVQCAPQCSGTPCSCAPADDGRRNGRRAATGCTLPRPDMLHPAGVSGSVGRMWGLANRRGEQSAVADGGWLAEAVTYTLFAEIRVVASSPHFSDTELPPFLPPIFNGWRLARRRAGTPSLRFCRTVDVFQLALSRYDFGVDRSGQCFCPSRTLCVSGSTRDSGHHARAVPLVCCLPPRHAALASMALCRDAIESSR